MVATRHTRPQAPRPERHECHPRDLRPSRPRTRRPRSARATTMTHVGTSDGGDRLKKTVDVGNLMVAAVAVIATAIVAVVVSDTANHTTREVSASQVAASAGAETRTSRNSVYPRAVGAALNYRDAAAGLALRMTRCSLSGVNKALLLAEAGPNRAYGQAAAAIAPSVVNDCTEMNMTNRYLLASRRFAAAQQDVYTYGSTEAADVLTSVLESVPTNDSEIGRLVLMRIGPDLPRSYFALGVGRDQCYVRFGWESVGLERWERSHDVGSQGVCGVQPLVPLLDMRPFRFRMCVELTTKTESSCNHDPLGIAH
jgi:hypothetical protein